jgi:sulfatase maturation enzyme AslB (radical SAM superfamily)
MAIMDTIVPENDMANYSAFVIDKERKPLHTLLPLKSPLAIVIDVSSICNLRCYFCYHCYSKPQQKDDNPFMPLKLFEKITDDLRSFEEPINVITVGGQDGEPLLNPDFCRYIKILKESKTAKKVKTNTNATTLTFDLSEKLIETGIDIISISINGVDNESYCRIVNRNINFDLIRKNVEYLYSIKEKCHIHIKCIGDCFSDKEKKKFMEIFSPFSDTIFIDNMVNQWNNISLPVNDNEDVHRFNMKTGGGGGYLQYSFL